MELLNININKSFSIICLLTGLVGLFFLGYQEQSSLSLVFFCTVFILLFFSDIVCSFIFAYIYHINIIQFPSFSWHPLISLLAMFFIMFKYRESFPLFNSNRNLRPLLFISVIFVLFVFFINLLGKGASLIEGLRTSGYYLGFLVFIPAYYLVLRFKEYLFNKLTLIAILFLVFYYCDLYFDFGIMNVGVGSRGEDFEVTRILGYDVRQFMIFYTYMLPAIFFMRLKNKLKISMIIVAVFSYFIIVLALYRLAMFYVVMGTFLTFFFIAKYVDFPKLLMRISVVLFILIVVFFVSGDLINQYAKVFQWTLDSFSSGSSDESANIRFMIQLPILREMFNENLLTGAGLQTLLDEALNNGMYGFVDFPFWGTLAAFGLIGMILYYLRFFVIFSQKTRSLSMDKIFVLENREDFFSLFALKAYFITMITFRLFYISWELTYDYQQAEFGLFVGAYFALLEILREKHENWINNKVQELS